MLLDDGSGLLKILRRLLDEAVWHVLDVCLGPWQHPPVGRGVIETCCMPPTHAVLEGSDMLLRFRQFALEEPAVSPVNRADHDVVLVAEREVRAETVYGPLATFDEGVAAMLLASRHCQLPDLRSTNVRLGRTGEACRQALELSPI